jgi:hypothetical protein
MERIEHTLKPAQTSLIRFRQFGSFNKCHGFMKFLLFTWKIITFSKNTNTGLFNLGCLVEWEIQMVTKWAGGLLTGIRINRPFHQAGRSWLQESRVVLCCVHPVPVCACRMPQAWGEPSSALTSPPCSKPSPNEGLEEDKYSCWGFQSHLLSFATAIPFL